MGEACWSSRNAPEPSYRDPLGNLSGGALGFPSRCMPRQFWVCCGYPMRWCRRARLHRFNWSCCRLRVIPRRRRRHPSLLRRPIRLRRRSPIWSPTDHLRRRSLCRCRCPLLWLRNRCRCRSLCQCPLLWLRNRCQCRPLRNRLLRRRGRVRRLRRIPALRFAPAGHRLPKRQPGPRLPRSHRRRHPPLRRHRRHRRVPTRPGCRLLANGCRHTVPTRRWLGS
jgi:hypothetical protein